MAAYEEVHLIDDEHGGYCPCGARNGLKVWCLLGVAHCSESCAAEAAAVIAYEDRQCAAEAADEARFDGRSA